MIQRKTCGRRLVQTSALATIAFVRSFLVLISMLSSPQVQLLHMLHENGGLVTLDGKLFVTGGHWKGMEGDYGVEVEVYNRVSNTWEVEGFLPRLWFYSGVCTVFLDPSHWPELFPVDSI